MSFARLPSLLVHGSGWFALVALLCAAPLGCGDDATQNTTNAECPVGSEGCPCTGGGACDAGLSCLSDVCVDAGSDTTAASTTAGSGATTTPGGSESATGATSGTSAPTTDDSTTTTAGATTGVKYDVGDEPTTTGQGGCVPEGCKAIDLLFAMDASGSMLEELNSLAATQAFNQIITLLEDINCGDIDYRIGVTDDNDNGWVVPNGWNGANPWFDSMQMDPGEIATAFNGATSKLLSYGGAPVGCEHVLSSAQTLLQSDNSGFVREEALLVVVLITDVDDYGWYDQQGGNNCGIGCNQSGLPVATIQLNLTAIKGGDATGVAAVVVAGDPNINGGTNFCGQPGTCCGGLDCNVFHADRLWEFADIQSGMNGYTANLCDGPQSVPSALKEALNNNIDLACQGFEPPQ
ncbi:MAG: VWA domain-containing protein [Myxococcales bacterium]|nr:VWA domain-containing protein [Myxococcales bacterium]MCB9750841.1 VWA domain-containing protein [Myxococcales bacterium]